MTLIELVQLGIKEVRHEHDSEIWDYDPENFLQDVEKLIKEYKHVHDLLLVYYDKEDLKGCNSCKDLNMDLIGKCDRCGRTSDDYSACKCEK